MTENQRYNAELVKAMNWLAREQNVLFVGQAVKYAGTGMFDSLREVHPRAKMEFPVAENFQTGFCIGLALQGLIPINIMPRWNFLLCATDQIVNHLDKLPLMSDGGYRPKVITRVAVGTENPVDPQDQHKGDFSDAFESMLKTVRVVRLKTPEDILPAYQEALFAPTSTILVEYPDYGKA